MFLDNNEKRKQLSKWIIGTVAACILIFLAIRYIPAIAYASSWFMDLLHPLLVGAILALVFNVPLSFIERHLFHRHLTSKKLRWRRPLAILFSLILVLGIFVGVAFLVIPELANALRLVVSEVMELLDQMATWESSTDYTAIPFGEYLSKIQIDWLALKNSLDTWLKDIGNTIIVMAGEFIGNVASFVVDVVIGFVFSIYILANKEKLKGQVVRLIRVWLPKNTGNAIIHVASVCSDTFHLFVAGQTAEAVILGTLCTIGMLILRLPYAPMIGALVGVTALIPYVGAFLAAIVGAFLILTVSPLKAVIFVIFLVALQQVEGNLIYPKVVGAKINLPSMWVLAAITVGGNLAGPIGMLLGVPASSAAYALLKEATEKREAKINTLQKADTDG